MCHQLARIVFALILACAGSQAMAGEASKPPARLIVPFTPGGSSDLVARMLADKLRDGLNQRVIVENRPGAGGTVGTDLVAKAVPDGQTLLVAYTGTFSINPNLHKKLPYDPLADFTLVTPVTTTVYVLVAHPALPVRSVKDLLALARARPNELNYGSSGNGSAPHLAGALFQVMGKVNLQHVPYRGGGPAIVDLVAGQLHVYFGSGPPVLPHVKTGRLRAIASTSAKRSKLYPDLPTIAESGVPGYEVTSWYGLALPAKAPKPILDGLHKATVEVVKRADFTDTLALQGLETIHMSPAEFTELVKQELALYARVVKEANITLD
ncbi:MAG: tripartite tricarboxylate transporter substrate binding protein [Burkholderiales bacterium]|nr:tripartite tricarboxylate transporter substrate binding protein [Burkholderiales bacterium]